MNKVRCYDYEELNEELLKQFSEGSEKLEELLKYCYQNKIVTRACCVGHENGNPFPYVSFVFNKELYSTMENLIEDLLKQDGVKENVSVDLLKEEDNITLGAYSLLRQEQFREKFFSLITASLKNSMENERESKYKNIFYTLNDTITNVTVKHDGIDCFRTEDGYFKLENNIPVESTKDDYDFISEMSVLDHKVKDEEIRDYLKNKNNTINI